MFPKDSPFKQYEEPEDIRANQDRALGEALESVREAASVVPRTTRSIPIDVLEEWVNKLEDIAWDTPDAIAADGLADEIRAFLPG